MVNHVFDVSMFCGSLSVPGLCKVCDFGNEINELSQRARVSEKEKSHSVDSLKSALVLESRLERQTRQRYKGLGE